MVVNPSSPKEDFHRHGDPSMGCIESDLWQQHGLGLLLLQASPVGIAVLVSRQFRILFANPALSNMLERAPAELEQRPLTDFLKTHDVERCISFLERSSDLQNTEPPLLAHLLSNSESMVPVRISFVTCGDSGYHQFLVFIEHVKEEDWIAEQLKEQSAIFRDQTMRWEDMLKEIARLTHLLSTDDDVVIGLSGR